LVLGGLGRLRAEHAELKAENVELRAQNAELAERIARLERLVSRNSGNSSMLPSADDLPGKKPPPGSRAGVAGASRASSQARRARTWAWQERPDRTRDMFPEGACACGRT
jgi:transposase